MFKDTSYGQKYYCGACEAENRGTSITAVHTCGLKSYIIPNKNIEASLKERIVKEIENKIDYLPPYSADKNNPLKHCYQNEGYRQALSDCIDIIKKA